MQGLVNTVSINDYLHKHFFANVNESVANA